MKFKSFFIASTGALMLAGCGHLGAPFPGIQEPGENEAVVYFYRPSSFVGGGVYYDINETLEDGSNNAITTLYNGGYFAKKTTCGSKLYWAKTEAREDISFKVENGKIYFVRGGVGMGIFIGRPKLDLIAREQAEREIIKCKELLPGSN